MATVYELALLCENTYTSYYKTRIKDWRLLKTIDPAFGLGINLYSKGEENVFCFRGSETIRDFSSANLKHLFSRNSNYMRKALTFVRSNNPNQNTIFTGHSLGGFLAISMAFYQISKIVAFNPPYMLSSSLNEIESKKNLCFMASEIRIHYTRYDWVTSILRWLGGFKATGVVNLFPIEQSADHGIEYILNYYSEKGRGHEHKVFDEIKWSI